MKKLLLFITMLLFPITAFAATTDISAADFTEASNNPNAETSKGITYNSQNSSYSLANGEYRLNEDIALGVKEIHLNDKDVIILLNGYTLSSTNDIDGTINITDTNLTVKGPGSVNCDSNYDDYAIRMNGNNNLTIEDATINGINTDMISTDSIAGTAHLSNVTLTGLSDLQRFDEVIIDDVTLDFSSGGLGIENSNNVTVNNVIANNGSAIFGLGGIDSVTINDANLRGPFGLYLSGNVNNLVINGGTFVGQMYSLLVSVDRSLNPSVKLRGGTFSVVDPDTAMGNIIVVCEEDCSEEAVYTALFDGYEFSDDIDIEPLNIGGVYGYIIKNTVSVVPAPVEPSDDEEVTPEKKEEKKEEKKNPATGDNIIAYISLLSLSAIGLSAVKIRKRS